MDEKPKAKRGFAVGDNASRAARRNHELGTRHTFTSDTSRKALEERYRERREPEPKTTQHCQES